MSKPNSNVVPSQLINTARRVVIEFLRRKGTSRRTLEAYEKGDKDSSDLIQLVIHHSSEKTSEIENLRAELNSVNDRLHIACVTKDDWQQKAESAQAELTTLKEDIKSLQKEIDVLNAEREKSIDTINRAWKNTNDELWAKIDAVKTHLDQGRWRLHKRIRDVIGY